MVEKVVHSCKEDSGVSQRLLTFITAVSGVSDEGERARLTATCLPSFVPCHLSGVALLDEGESGWSMVVERDGQRPASTQTEELLTDMELLFHESLRRSSLLIAATGGVQNPRTMVGAGAPFGKDGSFRIEYLDVTPPPF